MPAAVALVVSRAIAQPTNSAGTGIYNIRDFGGRGDGKTLDTAALQSAVDACNRNRGGTVLVPSGVFLIGTIELKSNVTLRIEADGKLLGSADGKQYHAAESIPLTGGWTMGDGNVALIFASNAENVTIEGPGTIDGQGAQFHSPTRGALPPAGISGNRRPHHLLFYRCRNLTVRDLSLVAGAYHSVRIAHSNFVKLDGIHIHNRVNGNNDGFHLISSEHVHISNCDVRCQDDACALFGSCKFITVTNCTFSTRWSVFRFGGGEAENIVVSNCVIYDTYGCPIKIRCSTGTRYENMSFSNLVMSNVTGPISIGIGEQRPRAAGAPLPTPGIVRNISFHGIRATVAVPTLLPDMPFIDSFNPGEKKSAIILNGADGYIENIDFQDLHVTFPGGGTAADAAGREIPRFASEYYAIGVPPAFGLYARQVCGLTLNNVRFEVTAPEMRPAVVFDRVEDAGISAFAVRAHGSTGPLLRFTEARDVSLSGTRVLAPAAAFLDVQGSGSQNILIDGGDLSRAEKPVTFGAGTPQTAVKLRL